MPGPCLRTTKLEWVRLLLLETWETIDLNHSASSFRVRTGKRPPRRAAVHCDSISLFLRSQPHKAPKAAWSIDKQMLILGHHHVSSHEQVVPPPNALRSRLDEFTRRSGIQVWEPVITTKVRKWKFPV